LYPLLLNNVPIPGAGMFAVPCTAVHTFSLILFIHNE